MDFETVCQHRDGLFKCGSIPAHGLVLVKGRFNAHPNKLKQNQILSTLMNVSTLKRRRPRQDADNERRPNSIVVNYQCTYTVC